jgi:CheY-like chemotaxis protein
LYYHSNVNIKTELAEDLLFISGSPIHLSKIIMNLCSNAVEAIPDDGEIRISTKNQYLDMPIRGYTHIEEGDYVTVTVSDNGTGINPKDIDRIFEPFYSRKVLGKSGTGLGMAVVWGTMNDHHGYISVESKEGEGTTFTLYFPVSREESQDDESRLQIQDLMGNGESILIVDDIKEQRDIVSFMLKRLGYSVHVASSGEEAVDFVRENPMDLLVLDMIMDPGIDGAETYKRIIEIYPNQKAIITSGFTETERVKEAQQMGAGVYLKKPYQLDKIGLAIKQELTGNNTQK